MNIRELAKRVIPFDTRRQLRFYQNRLIALGYSISDISHRSNKELLPIPPPVLRFRVHGDMRLAPFVDVGRERAKNIRTIMESAGVSISKLESVLEFGCGCARVLNWLTKEPSPTEFHGTDIDPEAINWCQQNYSNIEFHVNDLSPPLPFKENKFDLIYAISVFSHLDELSHLDWLKELQRVLKPEAYLLVTYHGIQSQSLLNTEQRDEIALRGFLFNVDGLGKYKLDGLPDSYQTAYISTDYIMENWSKYFQIERIMHDGLNANQSFVLMRNSL